MASHLLVLEQHTPAVLRPQIDAQSERASELTQHAVEGALAAHGDLGVTAEEFVEHVAKRLPLDREPISMLERLHAPELYLALACARGSTAAIAILKRQYFARMKRLLDRLSRKDVAAEDLEQEILEQLLCARSQRPPLLLAYGGRGDLRRWLEITAVRIVMRRFGRPDPAQATLEEAGLVEAGCDTENALAARRDAAVLSEALAAALSDVTTEDKLLLKHHFLDGLDADALAVMYGVHRATVFRRIQETCRSIARRVQPQLRRHLRAGTSTLRHLLADTRSLVGASLARIVGSGGGKKGRRAG